MQVYKIGLSSFSNKTFALTLFPGAVISFIHGGCALSNLTDPVFLLEPLIDKYPRPKQVAIIEEVLFLYHRSMVWIG